VRVGIDRANATLRNVTGAWIKDQKVEVTNGQITAFQVILEITFILD
jgi:dodecin